MKIDLFVSGELGFRILRKFVDEKKMQILMVCTDNKSQSIISFCEKIDLKCYIGNPRTAGAFSSLSSSPIPDIILSVNYLYILPKHIYERSKLFSINIHGSLLPKYRGRTPHVWAIINGEKYVGVTAHLITEECDAGKVILQQKIEVNSEETGAQILNKFYEIYPLMIDELFNKIESGNIYFQEQDETKATYFGKRTPEDGRIDWNWFSNRIKNWVRAQAYPYPGAFSNVGGTKIIINKIEITDIGFSNEMRNGLILENEGHSFLVKVPDRVIRVLAFEFDGLINKGEILG